MLPAEELDRAADVLEEADDVVLVCHVNPDADAMGSMLGLATFLAKKGKRVAASSPNGLDEMPRWVQALPGRDHLVPPGKLPKAPSVLVTLDAADLARLDGLAHLVEKAQTTVCIDHHRTNPGFGSVNLIDPEASATAEVVYLLIERMGGGVDADVATALYAGLVTDTGRFQFDSATPDVLRIAAVLREQPFDHTRLAQALYEDGSIHYLKLLGRVLDRVQHVPEANLVFTHVLRADLDAAGIPIQETDDVIDLVRTAREADVAAVVKEQRDGGFKVSLRSRGDTNVAEVAEAFGGGGHRLAAGYTSKATLDETVQRLIDALTAVNPVTAAP